MSNLHGLRTPAAAWLVLAAACFFVFTAVSPAQMVADGPGVTVDTGNAVLMHRAPVLYPAEARTKGIQGTVVVQVTMDAAGNVSDLRVISGPEQLRRAVMQSVLEWHFAHEGAGSTRQVSVAFQSPALATAQPGVAGVVGGVPARPTGAVTMGVTGGVVGGVPRSIAPSMNLARVKSITVDGLPDQARNELLAALPLHEGDIPSMETLKKMSEAVKQFDEHLSMSIMGRTDGTEIRIAAPGAMAVGASLTVGAPSSSIPAADGVSRINVSGDKQQMQLVQQVAPVYPPLAKQARIQGVVKLRVAISGEGKVQNLTVASGHPLLVQSALDAVKQWEYKPTLLNGKPVEVITDIDVNFTLAQ
jgi:TonB family protein